MHGKVSAIEHDGKEIFDSMPNPFQATRYHSLILKPSSLPCELEVTAQTDQDEIMAIRHKNLPIWGVQFHPESLATEKEL